jgi:phospholipid-binding lipoprotein MlaA
MNNFDFRTLHAQTQKTTQKNEKKTTKKSGFIDESFYDDEEDGVLDEPDPFEGLNRITFGFNRIVDGLLLRPAASLYDILLPTAAESAVRNVVDNAFAPVSLINHTLQGEGEKAIKTIFRFVINTTVGILGVIDAAEGMGLKKEQTSLNETFASWGLGTGPYIVLPILGPSSFRDASGKLGEFFINPLYYIAKNKHRAHNRHEQQMYTLKVLYGLDSLDRRRQVLDGLRDLERLSSDFYVGMRSVFFQKQTAIEKRLKERRDES